MGMLDKNNDGVVTKAELKNAIRQVMEEGRGGTNQGKKILDVVGKLAFLKVKIPKHLESVYVGKGTAAQSMHTSNPNITIGTCHTHGLDKLRIKPSMIAPRVGMGLPNKPTWKPGPVLDKNVHVVKSSRRLV